MRKLLAMALASIILTSCYPLWQVNLAITAIDALEEIEQQENEKEREREKEDEKNSNNR